MDKSIQELIRGYVAKARENGLVAERLFEAGDYEVCISRTYYTAFYMAHALLLSEGLTAKSHSGLVSLFGLHFVKTGKIDKKIGRHLSNLLEDRQKSDYNLFSGLDEGDAEGALTEAKEFAEEVLKLLTPYLS